MKVVVVVMRRKMMSWRSQDETKTSRSPTTRLPTLADDQGAMVDLYPLLGMDEQVQRMSLFDNG